MAEYRYANGVFQKIPEEEQSKRLTKKNLARKVATPVVSFLLAIAALSGIVKYAFYIDDEEQQLYTNKVNENPSSMRAVRHAFVNIYQQEHRKNKNISTQQLLYISYKMLLRKIQAQEDSSSYDPYDPHYNPNGRIYPIKMAEIVFRDLYVRSENISPKEFDMLLKKYAKGDSKALTPLNSSKQIRLALQKELGHQKN